MRLVVISYRLTKIKGILVSVGICALTNATSFIGSFGASAAVALAFSNAAQAQPSPGCNNPSATGIITSFSSGAALNWTAPTVCTVAIGTIAMINGTALTASGTLTHTSLTNNGWIHSSLTGTALNNATIAGFSNVVNVGTLSNVVGATITGDYTGTSNPAPTTSVRPAAQHGHLTNSGSLFGSSTFRPFSPAATGLAGPGNTFSIYGVNNQASGTIATFENDGLIQGSIYATINANTVSEGLVVGLNNAGSIGSLTNTGQILASLSGGIASTSNNLTVVGIASSGQIGTLTNSGFISGNFAGLVNGLQDLGAGPLGLSGSLSTIGTLNNTITGVISSTGFALINGGQIDTLSNSGIIQGGGAAILTGPTSSIGLLNNSGSIIATGAAEAVMILLGSITTLQNSGFIGTGGEGSPSAAIINAGLIATLTNSATGTIAAVDTGIKNFGGTIGTLSNSGLISGSIVGVANLYGGFTSSQAYGSIATLTNSGSITGGSTGILNAGTIAVLSNSGNGALGGIISGGLTGISNSSTIGSLTNSGVIEGLSETASVGIENLSAIGTLWNMGSGTVSGVYGVYNKANAVISTLMNDGKIIGTQTGIYNDTAATIGSLSNTGIISGAYAMVNNGLISALANSGAIRGTNTGVSNAGVGTITALANSGTISGATNGIMNAGSIGTLNNTGVITANTAIHNDGVISTLTNSGGLTGSIAGVYNDTAGTVTALANSGTISGGATALYNGGTIGALSNTGLIAAGVGAGATGNAYAIYNDGTIGTLSNNGMISSAILSGSVASVGIYNDNAIGSISIGSAGTISANTAIANVGVSSTIGAITNAGMITGGVYGIDNAGGVGTLINTGSSASIAGDIAILNEGSGTIASLTNSGIISGHTTGIQNAGILTALANSGQITGGGSGIYNTGLITALVNQGTISGASYAGVGNSVSGSIGSLTNSGTISAVGATSVGVWNAGVIGTLSNSGHISGASGGISNTTGANIGMLVNSGTIQGTGTAGDGVFNEGSIASLTNSGLIKGARTGIYNALPAQSSGAVPPGTIMTLTNASDGTISGVATGLHNAGLIGTLSNAGVISGMHALSVDGTGIINSFVNSGLISGPTAITVAAGGSLGAVTNSGTIAGNIVNASANILSITGGTGETFGVLTGFGGSLDFADIGQITNTKSNLSITSGNVLLNDHVNVGTGLITNAAVLQVNNPINITGSYLQTAAGTLAIGVSAVSTHGELNVSSAATVAADGHVVLTNLQGFHFAAGEQFTLIDALSGTYNIPSLTASAVGFSGGYTISDAMVDGKSDLVVCLTSSITHNCSGQPTYTLATTSNAVAANNAAGRYTGSDVGLNKLVDALTALGTSAQANRAGNQLLAEPHQNAVMLATEPALDVLNVITGHSDTTRLAATRAQSGIAAGEATEGVATWGEAFGGGSHQSEQGQFSGYSMSSGGVVAGGDVPVGETAIRLGAVFSFTHADLKDHGDRTGDTMGLNSYGLLGYATFLDTHAYADLIGGVLFDRFSTTRVIDFLSFNGEATGNHDGTQYVAKAAGGYRFALGGGSSATLSPVWGLAYSHLNQDGYTESGGDGAALRVNSDSNNSLRAEAGAKLEQSFTMTNGDVVPEIKLLYRHEFDNGTQLQTQGFAADPAQTTFSTQNIRPIVNTGVVSVGVNLLGKDGFTVSLKYGAEISTGYVSQGGSLRVRYAF